MMDPRPGHSTNTTVLQHCREGYVATCCNCGRFRVAFGTSLLVLDEVALRMLLNDLQQDEHCCAGRVDPRLKIFVHEVGTEGLSLVLNLSEVSCLREMIAEALWIHGVYSIVNED